MQRTGKHAAKIAQHVPRARGRAGTVLEQRVAADRGAGVRVSGHSEDLPALRDGIVSKQERAAFLRCLDHDRRHGQTGRDAVAQPEAKARHGHIRRELAHNGAAARDLLRACARKIQIDRRAGHAHADTAGVQRPLGGRAVDPGGEAGEQDAAVAHDLGAELSRRAHAIRRCAAGADDGDGRTVVDLRQRAAHIEHQRRIIDLQQTLRIGRILDRQDADVLPVADGERAVGIAQVLILQQPELLRAQRNTDAVIRLCGKIHIARRAKMLHERELHLRAHAKAHGQPDPVLQLRHWRASSHSGAGDLPHDDRRGHCRIERLGPRLHRDDDLPVALCEQLRAQAAALAADRHGGR